MSYNILTVNFKIDRKSAEAACKGTAAITSAASDFLDIHPGNFLTDPSLLSLRYCPFIIGTLHIGSPCDLLGHHNYHGLASMYL